MVRLPCCKRTLCWACLRRHAESVIDDARPDMNCPLVCSLTKRFNDAKSIQWHFDTWGCHGGWFRWEAWVELVVVCDCTGSLLDTSRGNVDVNVFHVLGTGWNNWNNDFWVMLPIFLVTSLLEGKERGCAPRKIRMEPENTPLEEASHLNQTNQGFIFFKFVP